MKITQITYKDTEGEQYTSYEFGSLQTTLALSAIEMYDNLELVSSSTLPLEIATYTLLCHLLEVRMQKLIGNPIHYDIATRKNLT